jgi:uncharacterized protein YutE (UPF0331/DUF86 family)
MNQTSQDLVLNEVEKLIETTKETYKDVKRFAVAQVWKILQLYIAATIQIIEIIATDLSSPEKKELAMKMIDKCYDSVFLVVDVPFVPSIIESYLHVYVKRFLMILVSSTIDSMVKIFREVGVFKPKLVYNQNFLK